MKFSSDLRRLYELEPKGRTKLIHKDNNARMSIFGAIPSPSEGIRHITLIANWFESNTCLGTIKQNGTAYADASKCRWVAQDADVSLKGPKEFADQYGADESTMMWLKHQELLAKLLNAFAPSTVYDLEYRVLVVAMAFQIHAAADKYSNRPRVQSRRFRPVANVQRAGGAQL